MYINFYFRGISGKKKKYLLLTKKSDNGVIFFWSYIEFFNDIAND